MRSAYLRTKNKKQNVFDSESRSDLSFTVQEDTEVIHGRSQRRNEDQLLHEGEPVRILGNTLTEGFGEETLRTWHQVEMRRSSREVSDSMQRQNGLQLYSREKMPQVQFQSDRCSSRA